MHHPRFATTDFQASSSFHRARQMSVHRHSTWTLVLHWSTVAALIISVACVLLRDVTEAQKLRILLLDAHRQFGLFVLLALGLRLAQRLSGGMLQHREPSKVVRFAAHAAHLAMYVMLFVLPLLGLMANSARGMGVNFLGLVPMPHLVSSDPDVADTLVDYHVWAAWGMLALVVAHIAAALWHHMVRRDGVLVAMLPMLKRRRRYIPR